MVSVSFKRVREVISYMELECDVCGSTKEFPDRLTVVEDESELEGVQWEIDIEERDSALVVTAARCANCSS